MITSKTLSEYMKADLSPPADDSQSYPVVYLGGFVHKEGTGLGYGDIIRVANILRDHELEIILNDHVIGWKILEAAGHLREFIKRESMNLESGSSFKKSRPMEPTLS
jgi:hypothetical protein